MKCVNCNIELLESSEEVEQEFKGDSFVVNAKILRCPKCGFKSIPIKSVDAMRRLVADRYRIRHGLLTSSDIRWIRSRMKMSQIEFAHFLGVSGASIKRWETWLPQNKSMDSLLRAKHALLWKFLTHESTPRNP